MATPSAPATTTPTPTTHEPLSALSEGFVGAVSAVVANALVYPLDVITTRLQVQHSAAPSSSLSSSTLLAASAAQGLTPTKARTCTQKLVSADSGICMSCGDLQAPGSGTNDTNDIDIDNDKDATAVEDNGPRTLYTGQVDAFVKILRSEGLRGLFAGMPAGLLQTFLSSLSYFVLYASLRQRAQAQLAALAGPGRKLSTSAELVLGAVAGGLSRCLTTPVSVVTTRRQTAVARSASASAGYVQTVLEIVRSHGIGGLWSGLGPSLILTVNPAITYGLFERLKGIVAGRAGRRLTPGQVALMGALTKSLATIVTYPYILAKVRMQSDRGAGGRGKGQGKGKAGTGLVGTLRECVAEGGLGGLYRGLGAQIGKAVVCQALLFVIKDALEAGVRRHLLRRR